jgi:mono/diheme cytochrome c family protein
LGGVSDDVRLPIRSLRAGLLASARMVSRLALLAFVPFVSATLSGCDKAPPVTQATRWTPADHERLPGEDDAPSAPTTGPFSMTELAWAQRCTGCHGANGQGNGTAPVPDFTSSSWHASREDAELATSIAQGRGAMPKFDLPPPVVAGLVAKVRSFGAPAPAKAAP